jgi:hypothetical protein
MSFNRNKDEDRYNTRQMVNKDPENFSQKNWLGHSGAAAKIDTMLLKGGRFEELCTSGRKPNAVRSHLNHLKTDHGLSIEKNDDDVYVFLSA